MSKPRVPYIDFLRAVALLLIILAHVHAPSWLTTLRCFDVPMIVFVSGLAYARRDVKASLGFFVHRSLRLVVPVWLFLAIVYLPFLVLAENLGIVWPGYLNNQDTISAFLFLEGYGYVWIIRVFLLMMLLTPLMIRVERNVRSWSAFLTMLVGLMLAAYVYLWAITPLSRTVNGAETSWLYMVLTEYGAYAIGYSIFFLLGLRMRYASQNRTIVNFSCIVILVLAGIALYLKDGGLPIEDYKYPPILFYVIYGCCMSVLFWVNRSMFCRVANMSFFKFMGSNTIWIYLWHIPFVYLCMHFINGWALRYVIVLVGALAVYRVQYLLARRCTYKVVGKYLIG